MTFRICVLATLVALARAGGIVAPAASLAYAASPFAPAAYAASPYAPAAYAAAPLAYSSVPAPLTYASYVAAPSPFFRTAPYVAPASAPLVRSLPVVAPAAPVVAPSAPVVAPAAPVVAARALVDSEYDVNPQYSYGYNVEDALTGDSKYQVESRSGDVVQGSYSLNDPDGTRRTVDYSADPINGFNAVVRKEPLVAAAPVVAASPVVAKVH